jgi:hypothetical protein
MIYAEEVVGLVEEQPTIQPSHGGLFAMHLPFRHHLIKVVYDNYIDRRLRPTVFNILPYQVPHWGTSVIEQ